MLRSMKTVGLAVMLGVLVTGVAVTAADKTYGGGVKVTESTPISALYSAPEKFVGKTVRIDGVVTAVCEEMGCWIAIAAKDNPKQTVRFQVDHHGGVVLPLSARGSAASAEGVFLRITPDDHEAIEAAREQAAKDPNASAFGRMFQVRATGAVTH